MAIGDFGAVLNDMEVLFSHGTAAGLTDIQLLDRFRADGEAAAEAAFTALVKRHGPMVLRVCRGELNDLHAAEDAFQATFLILARQARSIRDGASLASWLYGVARRVARRARLDRARRSARERRSARMIDDPARRVAEPPDLMPEVQEEVDRLPERYRSPIVLCYLEGLTHEEAACQLRIPVGTVKIRLSRGRERLRGRLIRRGLAPALIATALSAPARAGIPPPLLDITVKAALGVVTLREVGVASSVSALVQGVLRAMLIHKLRTVAVLLAASTTLIVTSLVLVSAFATPGWSRQAPERRSVPPPGPRPEVSPPAKSDRAEEVAVVTVKKSALTRTTNQPGTIEPSQKVDVLSKVSGTLVGLTVDIGSSVKRGDVLAELEAPELKLDLARAEALSQQAKARIATAKSHVQVAQSAVSTALAKMASAEAELKSVDARAGYRKKQAQRIRELVERGSVEHRLLEEEEERLRAAEAEAFAARVQVTVARAAVEEARAKLESAKADTGEIEEGIRLTEVDRERAQMMQDSVRIRSPIDGVVTRRNYGVGEFVRSGASGDSLPIVTIVQTRTVRVVTPVADGDVPFVDVGDPATFRPLALPGREYKGKISRTAGVEDPTTMSMRVEIDLDNADGRLRAGQSGPVEIQLETLPEAISIPTDALGRTPSDLLFCFRVVDGHAVLTRVSIREYVGGHAIVSQGLGQGDVVVANPQGIRDGQAIRAVPTDVAR